MRKSSLHENIEELPQQESDAKYKIFVGKYPKPVRCSQPYQPNTDGFMLDLVGREKELRLITAAWIAGRYTPPLSPLLVGEPGIGKNRLIYELARFSGRELFIMQGHEDVTAEDMACAVRFSDDGGNNMDYVVSPLTTAMLRGGICFIDEIGKIRPRALALLASVLDDRRYIDSILLGERVHAAPNFRFIAATNTGELNMLPEFIRSRLWPVVKMDFPEKAELQTIVRHQFPETKYEIDKLLDTFWALWEKHSDSGNSPSPRDAIHIFALASNLSELEKDNTVEDDTQKTDPLKNNISMISSAVNLRPVHIELAFNHLYGEGV